MLCLPVSLFHPCDFFSCPFGNLEDWGGAAKTSRHGNDLRGGKEFSARHFGSNSSEQQGLLGRENGSQAGVPQGLPSSAAAGADQQLGTAEPQVLPWLEGLQLLQEGGELLLRQVP